MSSSSYVKIDGIHAWLNVAKSLNVTNLYLRILIPRNNSTILRTVNIWLALVILLLLRKERALLTKADFQYNFSTYYFSLIALCGVYNIAC